jgi:hypothetical protein
MRSQQMIRYIALAAIIIAILYAYFAMPEKPEKGIGLTPKQLIETIEQKKAEQRSGENPAPDQP